MKSELKGLTIATLSAVLLSGYILAEPDEESQGSNAYVAGSHYVVLDEPVPTRDADKIEVIEAFSYGCPYCFELEAAVISWKNTLGPDVDFRQMHAVWNEAMEFYAQVHIATQSINQSDLLHNAIFNAIQVDQRSLESPRAFAEFLAGMGVDESEFFDQFNSGRTRETVEESRILVQRYGLTGVPQFIVNGKYRVDPMLADGRERMLDVVDFLIELERRGK